MNDCAMVGLGCVCVVCVGVFPEKYAVVSRVSLGHVCLCVGVYEGVDSCFVTLWSLRRHPLVELELELELECLHKV